MKLALFDLDGTLADTRADIARAVNLTRRALGLWPLAQETVVGAVGNGLSALLERTIPDWVKTPREEQPEIWMREYSRHWLDDTRVYPGVAEALVRLKNGGWVLAVLSNKPQEATRAIVRGLCLGDYFASVMGGTSGGPLKPDPRAVFRAIGMAEMSKWYHHFDRKEDIWMVGDHYTDIAAARAAGIKSCFCRYGFGQLRDETPTTEVDSPAGLFDALNG